MGRESAYLAQPWFWSDQYDTKLQIAGLSTDYDALYSRAGSNGAQSFWYYKDDELVAVDAVNDPRAFMVAKRLLEEGKSPSSDMVQDANMNLAQLLK